MYVTLGVHVLNFMVNHIEGRHFEETPGQLPNFFFLCVYKCYDDHGGDKL